MKQEDWEADIARPTLDGRKYRKIEKPEELFDHLNCLVKARRPDGYGRTKYLSGGILHHVNEELKYVYVRIPGTPNTFPLQIPVCEFWILPAPTADKELKEWQNFLKVVKTPASR